VHQVPPRLNPDLIRRADRWIGVPICFVLTVIAKIVALLTRARSRPPVPPQNVLFIELAEMGSTVLACPAVQLLRTRYPGCRVFFLLFKHIDESVRVLNLVEEDHILTIDVSSVWRLCRHTARVVLAARRSRIDTVITLETFARFSTILSFLSGARNRVGFHRFTQEGLYAGDLLTHRVPYNPHLHTWQSMTTLVRALDCQPDELPLGKFPASSREACAVPRLASSADALERVQSLIGRQSLAAQGKRLIVINPNASKLIAIRKWPLESYARLVTRLLEDPKNACAITGVASERDEARFILERVESDRVVDLTGRLSLRELIDLFNLADVLVTNDSGPAHFAALTNIHVVVFFGPETPRLYKPLTDRCTVMYANYACSPCVSAFNQRRSACTKNRCLIDISVDDAYAAVSAVLERPGSENGEKRQAPLSSSPG
jgi:ADP-heptose:LPS heptosyltransferase